MKRPIAISLAPNLENKDVLLALKTLFSPLRYISGDAIRMLEQWFRQYFFVSYAISFVSGRSALLSILKALEIKKNDEVILQAFTCVAVVHPILSVGATPIFIDINSTLTIDSKKIEEKITKKTKAIIAQHTFGVPSAMDEVIKIAKKHKIPVIEDCAHIMGGTYKNKKLGTYGIASFFSFGRDKACSSVFGGMAITNNQALGKKIRSFQRQLEFPSFFWVTQQLLHPLAFFLILPLYNMYIGKILLVILQKLHLLSFPVSNDEKKGKFTSLLVYKMPNALAQLALSQVKRLKIFNAKREAFVEIYVKEFKGYVLPYNGKSPLLRFPILVNDRDEVLKKFKKQGIYLGNWYSYVIDPKGVDFKQIGYIRGMCPKAEEIAQYIFNLPTYPTFTVKDAQRIIRLLKEENIFNIKLKD